MAFTIIAIEPLDKIRSAHLKNLKRNTTYYLQQDYHIEKDLVKFSPSYPSNFFSEKPTPSIEISAIVGKNGSGKSSLIELLIMGINNLFYSFKENYKDRVFHSIIPVIGLHVAIYYKTDNLILKIIIDNESYSVQEYLYDQDSQHYMLQAESRTFTLENFGELFFYTEVINYSSYAFNSGLKGYRWIKNIFHKNDGYQTPVVLNPFRENGNIKIDVENYLTTQRLLSNIFRPGQDKKITDNLSVKHVTLKLKGKLDLSRLEYDEVFYDLTNINKTAFFDEVKKVFSFTEDISLDTQVLERSIDYLIYKLAGITLKYSEYHKYNTLDKIDAKARIIKSKDILKNFPEYNFTFKNLNKLVSAIDDDPSHITLKFKQTLNYIRFNNIEISTDNSIDIDKPFKNIDIIDNYLLFLPPPIYHIGIKLKPDNSRKQVDFIALSSGEKQLIYSLHTIYYHLLNLNSVTKANDSQKIIYEKINIILDEIELYFHPEFQRKYLRELLIGLSHLNLDKIKSINFILATHSPFILSDLPPSCVLKLKDGTAYDNPGKATFGANIYDLLKDSFFLEGGFIGEFAKEKIMSLLNFLTPGYEGEKVWTEKESSDVIGLIGEPLIKERLMLMHQSKFKSTVEIREEIKRLENLLTTKEDEADRKL